MGMYDKLGDLLNETLESGHIYTKEQFDMPPEVKKAFEGFGISVNFTYEEAKKIYHQKLKFYHPDKNQGNESPSNRKMTEELIKNWHILADWYEGKR